MDKAKVTALAEQIIKLGDGQSREEFIAALQAAVAGSIYHSYRPEHRWNGVTMFCNALSPALQAIIDGYERRKRAS